MKINSINEYFNDKKIIYKIFHQLVNLAISLIIIYV